MSRYDLAVFDFDGTLADSADWFFGSLNEVAGRFGFRTTTEDERQALRRLDNREIIRRLQVPLWKLPAIARHMRRRVAENIDSIRLFGGIPEALTALRANGTRLAIVSSNSEANVRRVLGSELAGRIAFYGCGASLFGKTSKLRSAIRHCNVHRERTIYVGDETRDIEAARAAGTASGAVLWGCCA
jgi:phosphoglycolate phosphatase